MCFERSGAGYRRALAQVVNVFANEGLPRVSESPAENTARI